MSKLGEFVKIKTGKLDANASSENGEYPFFTCAVEPLRIDTYSYDCECVLVAGNGDLNVKYYNGKFDAYQRTYIIESKDKSILSIPYLYFFLDEYVETLRSQSIGGVIKYIKLGNLTEADLTVPSLSRQQEIVLNLKKATHLIDLCNAIIEKLDLLIRARFVEMFGEPILNPKRWKIATIGDVVEEVKYGTSRPAVDGGKYPYLRMNNLTYDGHLDLTDLKRIDIPDNEIEKCIVHKGDVLFNRTNSVELVGKTCVFNELEDMVIAGYIIRIRLKQDILPLVLSCFMNTDALKKKLKNMAKGAVNQANINAKELQAIEIYLPPLDLQEQFTNFVEQTEKTKLKVKQVLEKVELLKSTLMQKYFK